MQTVFITAFFLIFLSTQSSFSDEKNLKFKSINKKTYNEKSFSGPMGMGLTKSYETKNQKVCIYNTINGQERVTLTNKKKSCPKKNP